MESLGLSCVTGTWFDLCLSEMALAAGGGGRWGLEASAEREAAWGRRREGRREAIAPIPGTERHERNGGSLRGRRLPRAMERAGRCCRAHGGREGGSAGCGPDRDDVLSCSDECGTEQAF